MACLGAPASRIATTRGAMKEPAGSENGPSPPLPLDYAKPAPGGSGPLRPLAIALAVFLSIALGTLIIIPQLGRARPEADKVKCASNMKQIGLAISMYCNDDKL